jgi:hypothetical protein
MRQSLFDPFICSFSNLPERWARRLSAPTGCRSVEGGPDDNKEKTNHALRVLQSSTLR